ncbi:MAG: hypothetical protein HUU04_06425 [Verrucomicrobiae bacterium]|nr:hypothetical protein [Verrucomicrobiae bacterium]
MRHLTSQEQWILALLALALIVGAAARWARSPNRSHAAAASPAANDLNLTHDGREVGE